MGIVKGIIGLIGGIIGAILGLIGSLIGFVLSCTGCLVALIIGIIMLALCALPIWLLVSIFGYFCH